MVSMRFDVRVEVGEVGEVSDEASLGHLATDPLLTYMMHLLNY